MVETQTKPQDEANILKKTKAHMGFSFPLLSVAPRQLAPWECSEAL